MRATWLHGQQLGTDPDRDDRDPDTDPEPDPEPEPDPCPGPDPDPEPNANLDRDVARWLDTISAVLPLLEPALRLALTPTLALAQVVLTLLDPAIVPNAAVLAAARSDPRLSSDPRTRAESVGASDGRSGADGPDDEEAARVEAAREAARPETLDGRPHAPSLPAEAPWRIDPTSERPR